MQQIALTSDDQNYIHAYIRSRSFSDPGVIDAIAKDFIPRVAKYLDSHPELSFKEAVKRVHDQYGLFGFRAVADEWEHATSTHYRGVFISAKKELCSTWKLPLLLAVVSCISMLVYFGRRDAWQLWDILGVSSLVFLLVIIPPELCFYVSAKRLLKERVAFYSAVWNRSGNFDLIWLYPVFATIGESTPRTGRHAAVAAIIMGILLFFYLLNKFAAWKTLKKIHIDIAGQKLPATSN